jgi:NAD(P)-dependent dehydrogenase (short-subunit alcohol dehydrogenase family)
MTGKVALVTGASSGMGKETAKVLAKQGIKVYAGARRLEKMNDLKKLGIVPIAMDVTKPEDNRKAVEQIISAEGRIDILINNAGFAIYGPVEDIPMEDARYQFDVNLFGLADLTQLVLPFMRKQRSGRIVNISSMGGKIYTPLGAWYHATKHAVEGFSDCLRLEVKKFGIDVVVVEPGIIKTEFYSVVSDYVKERQNGSAYRHMIDPMVENMSRPEMTEMGTEPSVLAETIAKAATVDRPKTRYIKGRMAKTSIRMRRLLGDRGFDRMIMRMIGGRRNRKDANAPGPSKDRSKITTH